MKDACKLSLQNEIERMNEFDIKNIVYKTLSNEQIDKLVKKIKLLPFEYQNILFFRYYFNNTPSETEEILEIQNVKGKLHYVKKLLSDIMNLNGLWIDDQSIEKACKIALLEEMENYNNCEILQKPDYSYKFRQKLKDIKIAQKSKVITIAERIVVFALICILSFSAIVAVNAEIREKFFEWIIEIFPDFSIFSSQGTGDDSSSIQLSNYKINYIPTGFKLMDIKEGNEILIYNYAAEGNQKLSIKLFASSKKGKFYYDTEDAKMKSIIFNGFQAYTWQTDEMIYLVWYQEGIEFHISGNIDKEEIFKVAKNILK